MTPTKNASATVASTSPVLRFLLLIGSPTSPPYFTTGGVWKL